MHDAVTAIATSGVSPIVRIADNQGWMVKRALDAGAHGILVPLIYSVDDAVRLVQSAKFPPMGQRGFGSPFPMANTGVSTAQKYLLQANNSLLTAVQIETNEALELVSTNLSSLSMPFRSYCVARTNLAGGNKVDEIARVPGVDVLFVGPFDLGNNIGRPVLDGVMHPELSTAIDKVHAAAVANGKKSGIYCTGPEQAREYVAKGFHMVSVLADVIALLSSLTAGLLVARGGGDEKKETGPYGP